MSNYFLLFSLTGARSLVVFNDTLLGEHTEQIQSYRTTLVIPLICLSAFLIGLPTNTLALWLLVQRTKKLPSTILLINLTTCDLLLLLVLLTFAVWFTYLHINQGKSIKLHFSYGKGKAYEI